MSQITREHFKPISHYSNLINVGDYILLYMTESKINFVPYKYITSHISYYKSNYLIFGSIIGDTYFKNSNNLNIKTKLCTMLEKEISYA